MESKTVKALAATRPPACKMKFLDVRTANAEIKRLEEKLGLSPSPLGWNPYRANIRIGELEKLLAEEPAGSGEKAPGRARFIASTRVAGNARPATAVSPNVSGVARFKAAVMVETQPEPNENSMVSVGASETDNIKGRARFTAAAKKSLTK